MRQAQYNQEMVWRDLLANAPNLDWQDINPQTVNPFDQRLQARSQWQNALPADQRVTPQVADAYRQALKRMQLIGQGGYTAQDRAMIGEGVRQIEGSAKGSRDAAVQAMAMRGLTGGGAELAARLQADQTQANAVGSFMAQQQAAAQQRALQAMQAAYGMAYGQQRDAVGDWQNRANALDAFNAQNVGWQRSQSNANAQAQNEAARYNAEQRRGMSQQEFNNQTTGTQGLAGAYGQQSQQAQNQNQFNQQQQMQQQQNQIQAVTGLTSMI